MTLINLTSTIITLVLGFFGWSLFLMISTKILKTENNNYKTSLKVLLWPILVSFIYLLIGNYVVNKTLLVTLAIVSFIVNLVLYVVLVMKNYMVSFGRSLLVLLIAFLVGIIPMTILSFIILFIVNVIFITSTI